MIKRLTRISILWSFVLAYPVVAQDLNKNEKWYGTVKLSHVNNTRIISKKVVPGQGVVASTVYDASQASATSLNFTFGYFLLPRHLAAGVGLGLDGYKRPYFNTAPLYLELHYFLKKKRNTPFIYTACGGFIPYGMAFSKGVYFRAGAGYKGFVSKKLALALSVSYAPAGISLTRQPYYRSEYKVDINAVAFTLAFILF